jgi:hypothetical protein
MGGNGTWVYIANYPDKYAAAVPVCGWGDALQAEKIKHIPIWAFHGALDAVVQVSGSRNMILALENEGLTAVYTDCNMDDCAGLADSIVAAEINEGATLLYTEYEDGGHSIWNLAYNDPLLLPWVFAQSRTNQPDGISIENFTQIPGKFHLAQNYPNPFNPSTIIQFIIPRSEFITLEIFGLLGQKVKTLVQGGQEAGIHTVQFNGSDLASGVYFYCLQAGNYLESKKLLLLR